MVILTLQALYPIFGSLHRCNVIFRYVSVLVELTRMDGTQHGALVAHQMLDVAIRVQAIRKFAVEQMAILLENAHVLTQPSSKMVEVLYAAAWICGEYAM